MSKDLKITVLVENTVGISIGLVGEWGLSFLIEIEGKTILFDTGATGAIVPNARTLGINLEDVDLVVLSHGHYDHTGGLRSFLQYYKGSLDIIAHPDIFKARYTVTDGKLRHVGIPYTRAELEGLGANFQLITQPLEIAPNLFVSGEVPRNSTVENQDLRLKVLEGDQQLIDSVLDDFSLYVPTEAGLVIILGCAHAGIINIVEHARKVTGISKIHSIIGGTHLGPLPKVRQEETIEFLKSLDLKLFAPNHCTGPQVSAELYNIFADSFKFVSAGSSFILAH
ncbi:MAG: MBL fold metallo-hydrolase [Desulfitibacter sp. BRH_c19]|nr:MAG: MBL fold metallo-hydrolase [Desulfitibacter sp. BRH_c19]